MGERVALCIDEAACRNPRIIGLDGEVLDSKTWLAVFTEGAETRSSIAASDDFGELWVVSCLDVEPINLAASVKADNPTMRVRLVTADACGSLFSRAHTAQIDEIIEYRSFPKRYAELKAAISSMPFFQYQPQQAINSQSDLVTESLLQPERKLAPKSELAIVQASKEERAFMLSVVSGSGGAGKSSTSALAAVIASKLGHHTLLLDCDLQFGDVAGMVGADNPLTLDEALQHPGRLEAAIEKAGMLSVIAAPLRLEDSEEIIGKIPELLERLMTRFEVIVVNTGASWAEQHAVLLERSSAALFLIDQRASSVRACRHALELCARCGIATGPFHYALNRCAKGASLTSIDVSCALQGVPVFELKDGGRDVEDFLSGGEAAQLIEIKNEFAKSVEQLMTRLLPGDGSDQMSQQITSEERLLKLRLGFSRKSGRKS